MIYRASSSPRVLHVIAPAAFGGAETVVRQIIEALQANGVASTTFALGVADPETHPWVGSMREANMDVRCPPPSRAREYLEIGNALRESNVTAIHSHGYRADFAAFLAKRRGVRWISTAHGFTGGGVRMRLYEGFDRQLLRFADEVFAVSSRLQQRLSGGKSDNGRVRLVRNVPPALSRPNRERARGILGLGEEETIVGWVGRFSEEKGADRLPTLFADPSTACSLVLFGDGPLCEPVVASLASLEHLNVQSFGVRRDVGQLLAAFDLIVLPSRTEGMPMVVLEAMAAGTPAIAFDVGDVSHAVTSQTGWCIPANQLGAFAQALSSAVSAPNVRKIRGEAALRHMDENFSVTQWVEEHLRAYGLQV